MWPRAVKKSGDPAPQYGYEHANVLSRVTFSFVWPLIRLGYRRQIGEHTGEEFVPKQDTAEVLGQDFQRAFACQRAISSIDASEGHDGGKSKELCAKEVEWRVWRSILSAHKWNALKQLLFCILESVVRVLQPVFLRQLLDWFVSMEDASNGKMPESERVNSSLGWLWASMIALCAYLYVLSHHQTFWYGMRTGMRLRIQMISEIQAKVLRLHGASLSNITGGKVVNLVSNDVRRFDEMGTFWVHLIGGPLELIAVFVLVGIRMGFLASFAGISSLLLLIPAQAVLAKYIAKLRNSTAKMTDERVRLTGEAITGVLGFKMLAWEDPLYEQILKIRAEEKRYIRKMNVIRALNMALTFVITPFVSLITFTVARYTSAEFTVGNIFYSIALLALPKLYMCEFFVHGVEATSEAKISVQRIAEFLSLSEPAPLEKFAMSGEDDSNDDVVLRIKKSSFGYHRFDSSGVDVKKGVDVVLKDFSMAIQSGQLVAIVGPIGSGKTSILNVCLGELEVCGALHMHEVLSMKAKHVAFCPQAPWIISGTIRENILFGKEMDEQLYIKVIRACCLDVDLANMAAGDETEIGERGISLSGGQKARVSLARAAYSDADLLLLDDPLSAVDAKVSGKMFQECIGPSGLMKSRTRILVTHQKHVLPMCDWIIVLRDGSISDQGTYAELARRQVPEVIIPIIDGTMQTVTNEEETKLLDEKDPELDILTVLPSLNQSLKDKQPTPTGAGTEGQNRSLRKRDSTFWRNFASRKFANKKMHDSAVELGADSRLNMTKSGKLVMVEDRDTGSVTWKVYWGLLKEFGLVSAITVSVLLLLGQAIFIYGDYWLAKWASSDPEEQKESKWIWVYAIFVAALIIISVWRAQMFFHYSLVASTSLHEKSLARVLHAPLSFYHTNPTGRILNRFSRDLGAVDEQLPKVAFDALQAFMMVSGALVLLIVVIPYILPVFVPLIIAFLWINQRYLVTSRELKRFEAVTRSPVYANFNAIINGLPTIRAYRVAGFFRKQFLHILTINCSWWFSWITCARWIGFRLDFIVAILLTAAPLIMVGIHEKLGADLVGLALTQSLYLSGLLQWATRQAAEVENNMTSTERLFAYCHLHQEPPTIKRGGVPAPPGWPTEGKIKYTNVDAVYRAGLPNVLNGMTFEISGGESCGVVGRTGSGKSSLLLTIFRLIPITGGQILIDDIDISKIALDALRKQIAIIPQDPVLFSGTLRSNLDPWNKYSDAEVWKALENAQMKSKVTSLGHGFGLRMYIQEAGKNFSAGEKQLLCLARALLQDSMILALDEATANVDSKTDMKIQSTVRKAHKNLEGANQRTLLVIAHRLDTIMDCDKVMVLSSGQIIEHGSPKSLLSNSKSDFFAMARHAKKV